MFPDPLSPGVPDYWPKACDHLRRQDPVMGRLIAQHAPSAMVCRGDIFTTCARAIVGQQISVKAAASVWSRVTERFPVLTPASLAAAPASMFEALGLSNRKVDYLRALATHLDRHPDFERELHHDNDPAAIARLTQIRGIGRWTAEMALMFALGRPDVFPSADLGLQKAIALHYRQGRALSASTLSRISRPWQPYRTVATWYLWRSLDPEPVEY
jgi:DNA-3-methyladenine glycosylase II